MLSRFLAYPILGHHGGLPDAGSEYGTGLDHRLAPGNIQNLPSWDPAAIPLPASPMDIYQEMLPLICKQGRHPDPFRICFALRMLFSCLVDADYLDTERFCTPDIYRLRPAVPPCRRWASVWKTICIAKDSCTQAVWPRKNLRQVRPRPAAAVNAKRPSPWPAPSSANSANSWRPPLPACFAHSPDRRGQDALLAVFRHTARHPARSAPHHLCGALHQHHRTERPNIPRGARR